MADARALRTYVLQANTYMIDARALEKAAIAALPKGTLDLASGIKAARNDMDARMVGHVLNKPVIDCVKWGSLADIALNHFKVTTAIVTEAGGRAPALPKAWPKGTNTPKSSDVNQKRVAAEIAGMLELKKV